MLNLVAWRGVGVLVFPLDRMGSDYGRILEEGGDCSAATPDLSWEMGPGSAFGMMCSVDSGLLKKLFRSYMVLLVIKMRVLQLI